MYLDLSNELWPLKSRNKEMKLRLGKIVCFSNKQIICGVHVLRKLVINKQKVENDKKSNALYQALIRNGTNN